MPVSDRCCRSVLLRFYSFDGRRAPTPFVGRPPELAPLDRHLLALGRGRGGLVEVVGEAGIGKTRLVAEALARAEDSGLLILSGRAGEFGADAPFAVLVEALDEYLTSLSPVFFRRLPPGTLEDLNRVLPSLRPAAAGAGALLPAERHRVHAGLRLLLDLLSSIRPLVLIVDDAHWADAATVEFIAFLLRRGVAGRVLILLSYRPAQAPPGLVRALSPAERERRIERIQLAPLSRGEADELIRALAPALGEDERSALYRDSGGNPFFLEELSRSGSPPRGGGLPEAAPGVPAAVAAAIEEEIRALADEPRSLLRAAAVAGDPFEPDLAAEIAEVTEERALDDLDALLEADLVRGTEFPRRFRFRHPIVRRAVYLSTPPGWRLVAHARAAGALERQGAGPSVRAPHVEAAARAGDQEALSVLTRAGQEVAPVAPDLATRWYAAALRILPDAAPPQSRAGLLLLLTGSLAASGRLREARDSLREALALLPEEDTATRVQVVLGLAGLEYYVLRMQPEAMDLLHRTLAELPDRGSGEAAALKLAIGAAHAWSGNDEEMARWTGQARADARRVGDGPLEASALAQRAVAAWRRGRIRACLRATGEAARIVDHLPDQEVARRVDAPTWLGTCEGIAERAEEAVRHLERALAIIRSTGQGHVFLHATVALGFAEYWRGRLPEAARVLDEAIETATLQGADELLAYALGMRCAAATAAGDLGAALGLGKRGVTAAAGQRPRVRTAPGAALAEALVEAAEPARAREVVLETNGGPDLGDAEAPNRPWAYEILTRAEVELGELDRAEEWARRAEASAETLGMAGRTGWAARARAAVLAARGRPGEAGERALCSAAAFARAGNPVEAARSRVLAGASLAAAGDRARALALLEAAEADLARWGASRYRDRAARELRRLGRRMPRAGRRAVAASGVASLTARERQVAERVAAAKTNRQIAEELYLSERTVESHITRILAKLEAPSRAAVGAALASGPAAS
jgi:ATP/maltotriose-dependent transcriptional regulator MalT